MGVSLDVEQAVVDLTERGGTASTQQDSILQDPAFVETLFQPLRPILGSMMATSRESDLSVAIDTALYGGALQDLISRVFMVLPTDLRVVLGSGSSGARSRALEECKITLTAYFGEEFHPHILKATNLLVELGEIIPELFNRIESENIEVNDSTINIEEFMGNADISEDYRKGVLAYLDATVCMFAVASAADGNIQPRPPLTRHLFVRWIRGHEIALKVFRERLQEDEQPPMQDAEKELPWQKPCVAMFEYLAEADPSRLIRMIDGGTLPPEDLTFAVEIAGRLLEDIAVPSLLKMLIHESAVVREGAIYGLGHHRSERIDSRLREISESDPSLGVRDAAAATLEDT